VDLKWTGRLRSGESYKAESLYLQEALFRTRTGDPFPHWLLAATPPPGGTENEVARVLHLGLLAVIRPLFEQGVSRSRRPESSRDIPRLSQVRTNLTAGVQERVYVTVVSVESRARVNSTESLETLPTAIAKLAAVGPASEFVEKLMVFGQFVGSWDVVNVNIDEQDGMRLDEHRCEWHFSWVLGGRGVQDVLYSVDWSPDRFGSTFRCYDPKADVWRCTWMNDHDDTDDFFLILEGHLTIQLRDRDVELDAGELFVVPRGVEHCPRADDEASILADRARRNRQHGRRRRTAHDESGNQLNRAGSRTARSSDLSTLKSRRTRSARVGTYP
jgi:mannose-6-phosphate isomerase-like protein (cupin superfamily)